MKKTAPLPAVTSKSFRTASPDIRKGSIIVGGSIFIVEPSVPGKVVTIEKFEKLVRERLKKREEKIYLKKNYSYDIFQRHGISDEDINFLFNPKKIIRIYPNLAFPEERIDVEINASKGRKIKIILLFDPIHKGEKLIGKIGVITAFKI